MSCADFTPLALASWARLPCRAMNLEDHAGDVVRKARLSVNATSEAAAQAAGLTVAELGDFESSGKVAPAFKS